MKRGLIVGSLSLLLAALSPQVSATTATSMGSWEGIEEPTDIYYPASNKFVNDSYVNITDRGGGVFRMELRYRNGGEWWDSGGHDDRGRAEVKGLGPHQKHGETFDYLSTMRVNSTWRNTSRFAHVFQLFAVDGGSSVAYCVQMNLSGTQNTGKLTYRKNGTGSSITARTFGFTNGTYATYRIRVKTGTSGYVGLSINGDAQQGGNISMQVSGADGFRPKWGLYRGFDPGMDLGDTYVEHSNVQANNVTNGTPPSFTLSASPSSQVITAGSSTSYNVSVTGANGFSGTVALSASGLPSGATASFSPSSVTGSGTSVLSVVTSGATPIGTYTIGIGGVSGSLSANTNVILSVTSNQAAAPTFSPGGGTYAGTQNVTITSSTSGASIRYTLDGSTPTATSGILYTGPVAISSSATLKAVAYTATLNASNVTSAQYTIKLAQTITFPALPAKMVGDADFDPGATASSGLPVSYQSSNNAVATIVNGLIHVVGPGTASITASQAGDATYAAAPNVSQTLTVSGTSVTYYKIKIVNNPNYVLNVSGTPANGVNVNVYSDNGSDSQLWKLVDVGSGHVKIVPRSNQNYCLDCSTTPANGVNVQVWSYNGNTRQQWLKTDLGNGSYKITVRASATYCLDCSTTPANGTNVQVWTYNGNNRQQWILEPVVKVE